MPPVDMLTYYALRLAMLVLPRVPRQTAYRLCRALASLFWLLNPDVRRVYEARLATMLGRGRADPAVRWGVRRLFVELTKDYYDLVLPLWAGRQAVTTGVRVQGVERVHAARSGGRGVLAVFFHVAGFNLGLQAGLGWGFPLTAVVEDLRPPRMARLVGSLRSCLGLRTVPADRRSLRPLLHALRRGEVVALAADRAVTGAAVRVSLFDSPADLPAAPAVLALRSGAEILPILVSRRPDNLVEVEVGEPVPVIDTGHAHADAVAVMQSIADTFERHLRGREYQWVVGGTVWASTEPPLPGAAGRRLPPPATS